MTIPRILIAGAHSGSGKTSLTLALVAALKRRGLTVQTFKVGPDYLDPTYLAIASGRPCYNLDGWMCPRDYIEALFARAAQDADIAVIEGVMGLFDGSDPGTLAGSSAQIAQWLKAPVLLAVNVHGMARSVAALVAGFSGFEKTVTIGGVIANFCGSPNHAAILLEALAAADLPPLVGAVPRDAIPAMRRRHLGLVSADPTINFTPVVIDAFADSADRHLDLTHIINLAGQAPPLNAAVPVAPPRLPNAHCCLAVARDAAFHFYYPDLFDALVQRGCEIRWFSPLSDRQVPPEAGALYVGGGYPEMFAEQLSANVAMRDSVCAFADAGRPLYAECGGLIYLSRSLQTLDGRRHPLLGILPADTRMNRRKRRLGYVTVTLSQDSLWGMAGDRLRGHAFHYSELCSDPAAQRGWSTAYRLAARRDAPERLEGYQNGNILASYAHLHLAGLPQALDRFIGFIK